MGRVREAPARSSTRYDRTRPAYPDELVDHACRLACIGAGDRVLEIGCGTGQVTRSLLARGLRVSALEPGDRLIAIAAQNTADELNALLGHDVILGPTLPRAA
jgi:16S rRNA A1518/A1519 N6-dimethyltransferase RsmA/KsgA/DIM1 with predicted DNA glycosylase/AP lyase activity